MLAASIDMYCVAVVVTNRNMASKEKAQVTMLLDAMRSICVFNTHLYFFQLQLIICLVDPNSIPPSTSPPPPTTSQPIHTALVSETHELPELIVGPLSVPPRDVICGSRCVVFLAAIVFGLGFFALLTLTIYCRFR